MPRFTTPDDVEIYYKDWGTGPTALLLHGWPLSADSWDDQALAIAQSGFRVIAPDRRGFGRSSQPFSGYDYDTLADDVAALIEHTGARDITLVGFSMGGGEVARYLTRHGGQHVDKVALVASVVPCMLMGPDNPDGVPQAMFDQMQREMEDDRARFFGDFFKTFYGVGLLRKAVSDEVLQWSRAVAMQAGLKPTLACAQAFAGTDFRPDLPAFDVPTLIIHGSADKTVPIAASARPAARAIPNATLLEYEGAPHGLLVTDKQRVAADLIAFLRR